MKAPSPPLLPLLRSQVQGDLLALLFLHPEDSYSLTDIARQVGSSVRAVHAEANRLVKAGLVAEERQGNNRMLRAETGTLLSGPLTDLLAVTYGPLPLLTQALREVPQVHRAFIYGSWAARYQGDPGPPPGDVDVLVVGDVDPDDLEEAVQPAAQRLRREVNVNRIRPDRWENPDGDPFLTAVQSRPLVELNLAAETA
jgi:DNA-binding transcriptional ArsR family regulator